MFLLIHPRHSCRLIWSQRRPSAAPPLPSMGTEPPAMATVHHQFTLMRWPQMDVRHLGGRLLPESPWKSPMEKAPLPSGPASLWNTSLPLSGLNPGPCHLSPSSSRLSPSPGTLGGKTWAFMRAPLNSSQHQPRCLVLEEQEGFLANCKSPMVCFLPA